MRGETMRIPTIQFLAVGPPVDKNGTPTGQSSVKRDRRVWATIRNYWHTDGEWHHELLFYIGRMLDHLKGISPNYRYWWHSAHRLYYAIIGEKKYRPLTEEWERYRCVFSPDSRYLAGTAIATLEDEKLGTRVCCAVAFRGRLYFEVESCWFFGLLS
jgi:hypothetical protein